jgi:hypothetical protein
MKNLTPNQYWLMEHVITSFWHTFGISSGITFEQGEVKKVHYKKDKKTYLVSTPEAMQKRLKEWINWLERYKESWDKNSINSVYPKNYDDFITREKSHECRKDILKALELIYSMQ